jgi:hypothetical protein
MILTQNHRYVFDMQILWQAAVCKEPCGMFAIRTSSPYKLVLTV